MSYTRIFKPLNAVLRRVGFQVTRWPGLHPGQRRARLLSTLGVNLVLDVGANAGQYGQELRTFRYPGDIVSFEPLSTAFEALSAKASLDRQWAVRNLALGESPGTALLNIAKNSWSSSLLPVLDRSIDAEPASGFCGTETVQVETLEVATRSLIQADTRIFLKIDTQGYEDRVLAGAGKALDYTYGVELELSLTHLYESSLTFLDMILHMQFLGFALAGLCPGFQDTRTGEMLQADGIFIRRSS